MNRLVPALALVLVLGVVSAVPRAVAEPPSSLPQPADGWSIALVAEAPEIRYPTAVVVAPDGTIYLGQDPMNMPGPPTEPIDSVVTLTDGRVTVFADQLWSVMGLEWIDDTLYVVHPPYLSAFRDTTGDGRADHRRDLMTGLGPDRPGFNGLNNHVPAGLRLGMDGFLYIAVGDKGIPHGRGRDGAEIQLFGGGVIRIRPDGTALEVVSTGERNPLSVALSATDEVFTYGNDDDSQNWPNSLTHHIVGGHYGYPYEFLTRPDRCLPILGGQIGGAGTQGLCYLEDGLPERYRGNLFFCDWGQQTVFRFEVEKTGGSFKMTRREPIVTRGDVDDFRPFALAVGADGAGLVLVDWACHRWGADGPPTGRLYRLTYTGPDRVEPSPRPTDEAPSTRLAALDHPAHAVRLASQRRLAEHGSRAVAPLIARLRQPEPTTGRLHALWTLDAINTSDAREAIRSALDDPSADVRLQAARSAGIRQDRPARAALTELLNDPDAAVRREAAIALGKLNDPAAVAPLLDALTERDTFAAWALRWAIRNLDAWDEPALVAALTDPDRRHNALKLTDEAWAVPVANALATARGQVEEVEDRARIVANLAGLYFQYPPWSGLWFGTHPLAGAFPQKTQPWDREGMAAVGRGLVRALSDPSAEVRGQAIAGLKLAGPAAAPVFRAHLEREPSAPNLAEVARALGALADAEAEPALTALLQNAEQPIETRAAALDALAVLPGRSAALARLTLIYDPSAPPDLVAQALIGLGRGGVVPVNDLVGFLDHDAAVVRAAAVLALPTSQTLPPAIRQAVLRCLDDPSADVRQAAIAAVAPLQLREAIPRLIALADDRAHRGAAVRALVLMPHPLALPVYLDALRDRNADLRRAAEIALLAIRDQVADDLEQLAASGELDGPSALVLERLLSRFQPITAWTVIGPFPHAIGHPFLGEPTIDFTQPHAGAEGQTVVWHHRRAEATLGRLVLDDLKGHAGDRGGFGFDPTCSPDLAAFGYAEVVSDHDRAALLLVGSSGSMTIAVNDDLVYDEDHPAGRPYTPDTDLVPITLKPGINRILVQTRQGIGTWSFSVQVSEPSPTRQRAD